MAAMKIRQIIDDGATDPPVTAVARRLVEMALEGRVDAALVAERIASVARALRRHARGKRAATQTYRGPYSLN